MNPAKVPSRKVRRLGVQDGAHYWDRTSDPHHVKVMLYR